MSEFYVIDHSTTTQEASGHTGGNSGKGGDILYRWGNPMNYGRGTEEDKMLIGQHDANWIESGYLGEGNFIVYNNGAVTGFGQDGTLSSILEVTSPIDDEGKYLINNPDPFGPLLPHWSYSSTFFAPFMSGVRRLPNGNTLITVATDLRIFEVSYDPQEVVWEYNHIPDGQTSISKSFKYKTARSKL